MPAVVIALHPDPSFDEVRTQRTGRDLQAPAASRVPIPASARSFTSLSCKVWNRRSERPLACGA
jgi:hypothetical protein